jgi:RHS repeat-associated protein
VGCTISVPASLSVTDTTANPTVTYTYQFSYDSYGELSSITLPTGGAETFGYSNYVDAYGDINRWVTSYGFGGGIWSFTPSIASCIGAGTTCQQTNVHKPSGDESIYSFNLTNGAWAQQIVDYQGSASANQPLLTRQVTYDYNTPCHFTGCSGPVYISKLSETDILPNGKKKQRTYAYDNGTNHNITSVKEWDYTSGTFGTTPLRETDTAYVAPYGNNLISLPYTVTTYDGQMGSLNQVAKTTFTYDEPARLHAAVSAYTQHDDTNYGASNLARGDPTTTTQWVSNTQASLITHTDFDYLGNVTSDTDAGGHATSFDYGSAYYSAYVTTQHAPATSGGAQAHDLSFTYDFSTGLLASETDQNGRATTYTYDSLLRPLTISRPDGGETDYTYAGTQQIQVSTKLNGTDWSYSLTGFDNFGRAFRFANSSGASPAYNQTDLSFDTSGRLLTSSLPFQGAGFSEPWHSSSTQGDVFSYDALNRTTQITHIDARHRNFYYTGAAVRAVDEGNDLAYVTKISQTDGLGRTTAVCEVTGANYVLQGSIDSTSYSCGLDETGYSGFLTTYSYDALGNLTSVSQHGHMPRSYTYDGLSRLTSSSTPEDGITTLTYNPDGLLATRVRPSPNQVQSRVHVTTAYSYDALHRIQTITYTDDWSSNPPTPEKDFFYDISYGGLTQLNTNGRLTYAYAGSTISGEYFSYDQMGRIEDDWQCTPRVCGTSKYDLHYEYDLSGRVMSAGDGIGRTYTFTYDTGNNLKTMTQSLSGVTNTLISGATYGQFGISQLALGNTLSENYGYDTNRGWSNSMALKNAAQTVVYSWSNQYYGQGDVAASSDTVNGDWIYNYDFMDRLIGATKSTNGVNNLQLSYNYDRFGNRWKQNVLLGSGPAPQYTFSAENNRIDGYSYDAAGNLLNDQLGNTFTYDAEGRVVGAKGTYTYDYDASGRRVRTSYTGTGSYKVEYLYDLSGNWVTQVDGNDGHIRWEEAYAGNRHIATLSGGLWHWNHVDWLGTERYRTDSSGNSAETCTNLPFGDAQSCAGTDWSSNHFAGTVSDLGGAHTWARQLNTTEGRWTSPDPIEASVGDAQGLNRYAHVSNSPSSAVDTFGLCENPFDPSCSPTWFPSGICVGQCGGFNVPPSSGGPSFGGSGIFPGEHSTCCFTFPGINPAQAIIDVLTGRPIDPGTLGLPTMADVGCNPICDVEREGPPRIHGITPITFSGHEALECYNQSHASREGRVLEYFSALSYTPVDYKWKQNWWELVKIGSLKGTAVEVTKRLVGGLAGKAARVAEEAGLGASFTGTLLDGNVFVGCLGRSFNRATAPVEPGSTH